MSANSVPRASIRSAIASSAAERPLGAVGRPALERPICRVHGRVDIVTGRLANHRDRLACCGVDDRLGITASLYRTTIDQHFRRKHPDLPN